LLQARVEEADRNMVKAERDFGKAAAELDALNAAKASKEDIQRAQNIAYSAWKATVEAHKSAVDAETARRFLAGSGSGGIDSGGQREWIEWLQARVYEAQDDKEKAERIKHDAERDFDKAAAKLEALEAAKASKEDIQRAQNSVDIARPVWQATVEAYKVAKAAEAAALAANRGGQGVREVPFSFKPDVLARLSRPLIEWRAGETFDVAGSERRLAAACGTTSCFCAPKASMCCASGRARRRSSQCTARPASASRRCCSWRRCARLCSATRCWFTCAARTR
jgi:hypothetical protein